MTESQIKSSLSGLENGNQKLENRGDPIQISTFNFPLPKTNVAIKGYGTLDYSLVIVRLLVIALAAVTAIQGAGAFSFDNLLFKRKSIQQNVA